MFLRPGFNPGDMRRARAAAERLCILAGDDSPWERRDASVLLWHTGYVIQAATELEAYEASTFYRTSALAGEKSLVERMLTLMRSHPGRYCLTESTPSWILSGLGCEEA